MFVGAKKEASAEREQQVCRVDHYQTLDKVIVSVFGKGADKAESKVVFEAEQVSLAGFATPPSPSPPADARSPTSDTTPPAPYHLLHPTPLFNSTTSLHPTHPLFVSPQMSVDLLLPSHKRFTKTFPLFGPIDPTVSTYTVLGTKTEIILAKADARSWPSITPPADGANFVAQLAFSAGGGRGTVGAKEMVLDEGNRLGRGQ